MVEQVDWLQVVGNIEGGERRHNRVCLAHNNEGAVIASGGSVCGICLPSEGKSQKNVSLRPSADLLEAGRGQRGEAGLRLARGRGARRW